MKELTTSNGIKFLVDDSDAELISGCTWGAYRRKDGKCYVQRYAWINGRQTTELLHRVLLNPGKGVMIDHVNHDTLDNRRSNLRICNNRQNQWNQKKHRDSKSKYRGICWHRDYEMWMARISGPNGRITIGFFEDEIEAARAYDSFATSLYGEFAHLNFTSR